MSVTKVCEAREAMRERRWHGRADISVHLLAEVRVPRRRGSLRLQLGATASGYSTIRWRRVADMADGSTPPDAASGAVLQLRLANVLVEHEVADAEIALDDAARRLGYGGGFYDRTLAAIRAEGRQVTVIGIAYDEQQTERVPTGPHDMRLDGVLAPAGLRLVETG